MNKTLVFINLDKDNYNDRKKKERMFSLKINRIMTKAVNGALYYSESIMSPTFARVGIEFKNALSWTAFKLKMMKECKQFSRSLDGSVYWCEI